MEDLKTGQVYRKLLACLLQQVGTLAVPLLTVLEMGHFRLHLLEVY